LIIKLLSNETRDTIPGNHRAYSAIEGRAYQAVNAELINCYWQVGEYISRRIASATWGDKTIDDLAKFIEKNYPDLKGYHRMGLYRMRKFYQSYSNSQMLSPAVKEIQGAENQNNAIVSAVMIQLTDIRETILAQIGWSHHLIIFTRARAPQEREFYIRACVKERYSTRELDRQISSGLFERVMLGKHRSMSGCCRAEGRKIQARTSRSAQFLPGGVGPGCEKGAREPEYRHPSLSGSGQ
jgi:predicted nuclease of restriction endonuclease-like (RecB) superfamily